MGIEHRVASVIAREHAYRQITGDVLMLGRQTMFFTPEHAQLLIQDAGIPIPDIDFVVDAETRLSSSDYISDRDFFRLLGLSKVKALDVSPYEGADIVHDLTKPIPQELERIADFILDGSTLDNVFDPATVLRNEARMLRPGGRLVAVNVASNTHGPYIIPTAHLLLDYFVTNGFSDARVYVFVYHPDGRMNAFTPDLTRMRPGQLQPANFTSPYTMALVAFAEKGEQSTWDHSPVQHQYRDHWDGFAEKLAAIEANPRPHPARSTDDAFIYHDDYLFITPSGMAVPSVAPPTPEPPPEPEPLPELEPQPITHYRDVQGWTLVDEIGRRALRRIGFQRIPK
ncbi:hypothetical protein [Bradyrhizobium sp. SZCCHNRI2009]|nr:hypothetical protein [Bradyrhizobium sp. SZCCHNRI2009]